MSFLTVVFNKRSKILPFLHRIQNLLSPIIILFPSYILQGQSSARTPSRKQLSHVVHLCHTAPSRRTTHLKHTPVSDHCRTDIHKWSHVIHYLQAYERLFESFINLLIFILNITDDFIILRHVLGVI